MKVVGRRRLCLGVAGGGVVDVFVVFVVVGIRPLVVVMVLLLLVLLLSLVLEVIMVGTMASWLVVGYVGVVWGRGCLSLTVKEREEGSGNGGIERRV